MMMVKPEVLYDITYQTTTQNNTSTQADKAAVLICGSRLKILKILVCLCNVTHLTALSEGGGKAPLHTDGS